MKRARLMAIRPGVPRERPTGKFNGLLCRGGACGIRDAKINGSQLPRLLPRRLLSALVSHFLFKMFIQIWVLYSDAFYCINCFKLIYFIQIGVNYIFILRNSNLNFVFFFFPDWAISWPPKICYHFYFTLFEFFSKKLFHLPDRFGGTDVNIEAVFATRKEFHCPRLSESLSVHLAKYRLVVRLLVETQRHSEGPHCGPMTSLFVKRK